MSTAYQKLKNVFVAHNTPLLQKIELVLMLGIIFSIFFPIRYVLENKYASILGYYSDFTSISIYLSFLFVIGFIGIGIYRSLLSKDGRSFLIKFLLLWISGLVIYHSVVDPANLVISLYTYMRISCVLLLGYYVYKWRGYVDFMWICGWAIVLFGTLTAGVAILQFSYQHSIGINILGESPLSVSLYGVAKIVSRGTTYIRGYGTLPHPNILGGFLVIVSLLNLYLLNNTKFRFHRIFLSITYFLTILGLFITFSRSALLALTLGLITWGIISMHKHKSLLFMRKIWIVPISLIVSTWVFFPYLVSRGNILDQSAVERGIYNQVGWQILKSNWVVGTGPGTNMFHMTQKLQYQLDPWNIQPIHNFWLILCSEWGIIGLFMSLFLIYGFYRIWRGFLSRDNLSRETTISCWGTTLIAISIAIFTLFWFDHYFYTIWPAQMFLAIIIGLTWKSINSTGVSRET